MRVEMGRIMVVVIAAVIIIAVLRKILKWRVLVLVRITKRLEAIAMVAMVIINPPNWWLEHRSLSQTKRNKLNHEEWR